MANIFLLITDAGLSKRMFPVGYNIRYHAHVLSGICIPKIGHFSHGQLCMFSTYIVVCKSDGAMKRHIIPHSRNFCFLFY
jgi:hypothetical protein